MKLNVEKLKQGNVIKAQNGLQVDNTRTSIKEKIKPIPLNKEQQQNFKLYGSLHRPEVKQTYLSQGRKLTPAEQQASNKKLAEQGKLQAYQKQQEQDAKNLEKAVAVAPYVIPGIGQAMWAGKAVDLAVSGASDGKYKSWGNAVSQITGDSEWVGELTNPGYYAWVVGKLATPLIKKSIQSSNKLPITKPFTVADDQIGRVRNKSLSGKSVKEYDPENAFSWQFIPLSKEEISNIAREGITNARNEMSSNTVKNAFNKNIQTQKRLGLPDTRHSASMKLKFEEEGVDNWMDYRLNRVNSPKTVTTFNGNGETLADFTPKSKLRQQLKDAIRLDPNYKKDILTRASHHETLHAPYTSEGDFMPIEAFKLNRVLKPNKAISEVGDKFKMNSETEYLHEYLSSPEILTNIGDVGRKLGIKPGDTYPGLSKFKNMLQNYTGEKGFIVESLKLDKPVDYKHVFDIMNRSALGAVPAAGLYGLTQSKKQGGLLYPK